MASRETDPKGIPLKGAYPDNPPVVILYSGFTLVFALVGAVAAWFLCYTGEAKRAKADTKIAALAEYELGWLYLGLLAIKFGQLIPAIVLGDARKFARIHPPDQHVYEVKGAEGSKLGYVLMAEDGALGRFNRAQRAWCNYHENLPTFALLYVFAGCVFPFESFVIALLWTVARCMTALGYTESENGRMPGHIISQLVPNVLQGMIMIVAIKSL